MKKIVDGLLYDTDVSTRLGKWSFGSGMNDFNFIAEELFRSPHGRYFIAGRGGAHTKYAEEIDTNSTCGGSDIVPVDEDEARNWMETHAAADDYIAAFGKPEEA